MSGVAGWRLYGVPAYFAQLGVGVSLVPREEVKWYGAASVWSGDLCCVA